MKQILSICFLFMFMLISTSVAAEKSISIKWQDENMTADIKNAPINEVLKKIEKEQGLLFTIADPLLNKKISVSFKNLKFSEAMKRILKLFNYTFIFDKNGSLKKVNVVAMGDPANMNNLHISGPKSPDNPPHVVIPEALPENSQSKTRLSPSDNRPTPEELEAMNPGAGNPPDVIPGSGKIPDIRPDTVKPRSSSPSTY